MARIEHSLAPTERDWNGEQRLLLQLLRGYTGGQSSSVTVEEAQEVLCSMRLTVSQGREAGCGGMVEDAYARGLEVLHSHLRRARVLLRLAQKNLPSHASQAWRDSLAGAAVFFRLYSPRYAAHHIPGYFDYPTAVPMDDGPGVLWVRTYLERLCLEADFCRAFPTEAVGALLGRFGRRYQMSFYQGLENLAGLLFDNSFSVLLAGGAPLSPLPDGDAPPPDGPEELHRRTDELIYRLNLTGRSQLAGYLHECAAEFIRGVDAGSHRLLLPCEEVPAAAPELAVNSSMDDGDLRRLLDDLPHLSPGEQADRILAAVSSPDDLVTILDAGCLTPAEVQAVITRLPSAERALLAAWVEKQGGGEGWAGLL